MRQVLAIFRKDVRHHWPEALLSIALLAAYALWAPRTWNAQFLLGQEWMPALWSVLPVLLILSWGFLTVRVIQGESLVGDRQFWVTRPYEWPRLHTAKALFFALFIGLPLLIAGYALLIHAGFHPEVSWLPRLLWTHLSTVFVLFVVLIALACITANLGQMLLALLAVGVVIACLATSADYLWQSAANFNSVAEPLSVAVMVVACVVIALWQYARRRTRAARLLAIAATVAIASLTVATPYMSVVDRDYALLNPAERSPMHLALIAPQPYTPEAIDNEKPTIEIEIPVEVSQVEAGSLVFIQGMNLSLEAPDGSRWQTRWLPRQSIYYPEQTQIMTESFNIDRRFYERTASVAVHAQLDIAYSVWRDGERVQVSATERSFPVSGLGYCSLGNGYQSALLCRVPFESRPLVMVHAESSKTDCFSDEPRASSMVMASQGWSNDHGNAWVSPVELINITMKNHDGASSSTVAMCPGTPLYFSFPEKVRQLRAELNLGNIRLADYGLSNRLGMQFWRKR